MPQFDANVSLPDGTRFITHSSSGDRFVFGVKAGHIVSINISSSQMGYYRTVIGGDENKLMGASGVEQNLNSTYKKSALDTAQHDAVHLVGMGGPDHEHFDSRKGSVYDGIYVLAMLIPKIAAVDAYAIATLAKSTST